MPAAQQIQVGDDQDTIELFHRNGWTDGLPIVPPTPERVAFTSRVVVSSQSRSPARGNQPARSQAPVSRMTAPCCTAQL